jgi:hypothetical protein
MAIERCAAVFAQLVATSSTPSPISMASTGCSKPRGGYAAALASDLAAAAMTQGHRRLEHRAGTKLRRPI